MNAPAPLVLLVDDDTAVLASLTFLLEGDGFRVLTARDGAEALARLALERPGLIVLDLDMAPVSGQEFRAAQRAHPAWASIPVVLHSAAQDLAAVAGVLGIAHHCRKGADVLAAVRAGLAPSPGTAPDPAPPSVPLASLRSHATPPA